MRAALFLIFVVGLLLLAGLAPPHGLGPTSATIRAGGAGTGSVVATTPAPRATPSVHSTASAVPATVAAANTPRPWTGPLVSGWKNASFFQNVRVAFYGTGLPYGFRTVPYVNNLPLTTHGFWMNLTTDAPLVFANVTIWGNQWPGTNDSNGINGFLPTQPALVPMVINSTDPAQASFFFDDYRFFWPGSSVSFNITVVGLNSTPSQLKSASNLSVPENYPGGFVDAATWVFNVGTPWASSNFSNDIAVSTTPNVLGTPAYAPNPMQSLSITLQSIPVNGVVTPIPAASLAFSVSQNGSSTGYSDPFGPVNHTQMATALPIGPYPGSLLNFTVTAWLPWEGGEIDIITSPAYTFTWSSHGGWWHPLSGLLGNVNLATYPSITGPTGAFSGGATALPTEAPVTVTIHEPIENVTIASAQVVFTFTDGGVSHSGTLPMTALSANTSSATLPGLPPGASLTFYLVAKDIYGDPIASGNYTYTENGPTSPSLPSGRGLVFVEVLDLAGSGLQTDFPFSVANSTWYASANANTLGFGIPLLPNSTSPAQLWFGSYTVAVQVFGVTETATVTLSPSSPTPTIVFYGESHPLPVLPTQALSAVSLVAIAGLVAMAVVTLPLALWFEERRARAEEEQRRISV
jgi:hypothetical protein